MPAPQPRDSKGRFLPYPKPEVVWSTSDRAALWVTAVIYLGVLLLPLWLAAYGAR